MPEPEDYDPSTLPSLTYIHGKGEEYESGYIDGQGRIRIGATHRDCKIFVSGPVCLDPQLNFFAISLASLGHLTFSFALHRQTLALFRQRFTTRRSYYRERLLLQDSICSAVPWVMLNLSLHHWSIQRMTPHSWTKWHGMKW